MQIPITCTGADILPVDALQDFQGGLKVLSPANMEKLKMQIRLNGMNVPAFVWKHEGRNMLLDGHQRLKALRALLAEGYTIAGVPVAYISASDEADARRKLLAITSQYGEFEADGYMAFIEGLDIDESLLRLVDVEAKELAAMAAELADAPVLSSEDRQPFRSQTFILHDSQYQTVLDALDKAKAAGGAESDVNENSNGNALAFICAWYACHG